jgi:hypothetical protein
MLHISEAQQSALTVQVWAFVRQYVPASFGPAQTKPLPPGAGTHGKQPTAGPPSMS